MPSPVLAFGRRYAPDPQDAAYPMRLLLDPLRDQFFMRGLPEGARHYMPGPMLAQGETGTCVAHGWTARITAAPVMQPVLLTPYDLYRKIVLVDEWSDNDWEATAPDAQLQSGTSVRAGAKVAQALGYLTRYLWAESVEDVRAWHLAGFGTVVLGTAWHEGMRTTDADGFVSATGPVLGGHCYVSTGWNDRVRHNGRLVPALRCQNSWGKSWGRHGGRFWLPAEDLVRLIADRGEVCAPVEQRLAA